MLNPNYIVGLVDGEGSFTVYVRNPDIPKKAKRRVRVEPRFYLKLIEKDKNILYELMDFFGCGNVYFQRDDRRNRQNCYRYEVANRNDLKKVIISFFKRHKLRSESRKKDFAIFCKIMKMIGMGKHLTKEGLREIYKIKTKMH
jgi:hypothetical protein